MKKNCKKQIKQSLELKKATVIHLTAGLIKRYRFIK